MGSTKKSNKTKFRDMPRLNSGASRFAELYALLMNAVKITKRNGDPFPFVEEAFIKEALFSNGIVGHDKIADAWTYVDGEGIDDYGKPTKLNFHTDNGKVWQRKASYADEADGAYIIYALPSDGVTFSEILARSTDFMEKCDVAINQNLEACKTPYIVVCRDADMRLSFYQALQEKTLGQACIVVSEELGDGLKAVNVGVEYLVDKFTEAREREANIALSKIGILTADEKRERVQSAEVNAGLGKASDYIYLLIDTFNKQTENYGIDAEMSYNGSMEEIYLDEAPTANERPNADGDVIKESEEYTR